MRRFFPLLLLLALTALGGCENGTEPNTPGGGSGRELVMTNLTDLPRAGGNVTAVSITSSNTIVAVIDGKIYSLPATGGDPQLINGEPVHMTATVAPSGEIHAVTPTEFRTYEIGSSTFKTTPIPADGPLATNGRVESAEIKLSPAGEPYMVLTSNYPRTYTYYSTDKGTTWRGFIFPTGGSSLAYQGDIAFTPSGDILAGDYQGLFRTSDRGATWTRLTSQMPNFAIKLMVAGNGDIYRYVPGGGNLSISRDGGTNFTDLTAVNAPPFMTGLRQSSDGTLYAISNNPISLLRSTDAGASWGHVIYGQGQSLAIQGSLMVMGLAGTDINFQRKPGGLYISQNSGATWTSAGMGAVELITDFGFDADDKLMILADRGLFRRTSAGWQALGSQPHGFGRLATAPGGRFAIATASDIFFSGDNGLTWSRNLIPDYVWGGIGTPSVPALVGRTNGEFILSVTEYRDNTSMHTNGQLYRVATDGTITKIPGVPYTFSTMVEDRNGVLYGSEIVENFNSTLGSRRAESRNGGITWTDPTVKTLGAAFNSANRYFRAGANTPSQFALGELGTEIKESEVVLKGYTSEPHYIRSAKFDASDRLYLLTIDKGLFISETALK